MENQKQSTFSKLVNIGFLFAVVAYLFAALSLSDFFVLEGLYMYVGFFAVSGCFGTRNSGKFE